jgi:hypothetical protein
MPRIIEYINKKELTPSTQGDTAWTGAGRRMAPAYNEAANLSRQGAKDIQAGMDREAASTIEGAKQQDALVKSVDSQWKDLFDIGYRAPERTRAGGGGGGGAVRGAGGGGGTADATQRSPRDTYGAANEILGGAAAIAQGLHPAGPGGKLGAPGVSDGTDPHFPLIGGGGNKTPAYSPALQGGTPTMTGSYDNQLDYGFGGPKGGYDPGTIAREVKQGDALYQDWASRTPGFGPDDPQRNPQAAQYSNYGSNQSLFSNDAPWVPGVGYVSGPSAPPSAVTPSWSVGGVLSNIGSAVSNWAGSFATPDTQAAGDAINNAVGS